MSRVYEEIFDFIQTLEIIDTHEHLPFKEEAREKPTDVLREYLSQYFKDDLFSSGLSQEEFDRAIDIASPLPERWKIVEPYWEACRYTGYGRALDAAAQGLYGIESITGETLEALDAAFQQSLQPGHFRKVLKEKSKIRISLLDSNLECDREFFRSVYRLDHFILPRTGDQVRQVETETGIPICAFEDWLEACERSLDQALEKGAVALKSALAYLRPLAYERVVRADAERAFNEIWNRRHFPDWEPEVFTIGRPLQDFMMHSLLRLANRRSLTVQFHTGLHAGNNNLIRNSDPTLLSNLFMAYPNVRFDLFHIGYPYQNLLSALAKNFPNVTIDMCWAHIISPTASVQALIEWIDSVPINKISAFGGDYGFIDAIYGHQLMARQNVSQALAVKVEAGVFDLDRAKQIARMLFIDNPIRIFNLADKI